MTDLSNMSDDDLAALYQKAQQQPAPDPRGQRSVWDTIVGNNGPRMQFWPERLVRGIAGAVQSGATLPGDVVSGQQQMYLPSVSDDPRRPDFIENAGPDGRVLNPQMMPRMLDAATIANPINPMVRSGDRAIPGALMSTEERVVPTADALKARGGQQLEQARNAPVDVASEGVKNLGATIENTLQNEKGIYAELAPRTFAVLSKLREPPDGSVSTIGNLQNLRRSLGHAAGSADATERNAASLAIKQVDEWIAALPESGAVAGSSAADARIAAKAYEEGRGNYAAAKRSEDVTGRAERADLRTAATNSGRNIDNATRQRFVDILTNQKAGRGYSADELEQVEGLVRGTPVTNGARYVGNLLGGGGGFGQALTAGGAAGVGALVGGPAGAVIGATVPATVGAAAKALANALTKRAVGKLDEDVRSRSPMYNEMPLDPSYPAMNAAIVRALMMQSNQQGR